MLAERILQVYPLFLDSIRTPVPMATGINATARTPDSPKEGNVLTINESPSSVEGHGTVTGNQPIDPPSAEGHKGVLFFSFRSSHCLNAHQRHRCDHQWTSKQRR